MSIRAQQKKDRQEKIIEAATALFIENGIANVGMQEIADEAKIGIATLFRYFPKKDYIVVAVSNSITAEMNQHVKMILQKKLNAYQKIELVLNYYMESLEDPELKLAKFFDAFDLYDNLAEEMPELYDEYRSNRNALAQTLLMLAKAGAEDGSIKKDIDGELFIITMVQNFSLFSYKSRLTKHDEQFTALLSPQKQLELMKDVFLQYIRT